MKIKENLEMSEHKIAVLFVLKTMKVAFSNRQLIEILSEAEIIELLLGLDFIYYFEKFNMVRIMRLGGVEHFKITPEGKRICELYEEQLPQEIRLRIQQVCHKILIGDHDLNRAFTKVEALREGVYNFKCGVLEHNEPLFEINVRTSDDEQIWKMAEYFRANPAEIYEQLMKIFES